MVAKLVNQKTMKIRYTNKRGRKGYAVIQDRNIENDGKTFTASYKGFYLCITTDHGHGKAPERGKVRYDIVVQNKKNGMNDVDTWEDLPNLRAAIKYALEGAGLIPETMHKAKEED